MGQRRCCGDLLQLTLKPSRKSLANDQLDSSATRPTVVGIDANAAGGLTSFEAHRRLEQFGPNTTPDPSVHPFRLVLSKFVAPVPCLLEAAILLQLVIGEYIEAGIIAVLLVFNAALGLLHEGRAQATIAALKSRLALWASRSSRWRLEQHAGAELVPGDVVKLSLGSVVAPTCVLSPESVLLDQSMITGESMPIEAGPGAETFAGALVRRGEAVAQVLATGARTQVRPHGRARAHRACREHTAEGDFPRGAQSRGVQRHHCASRSLVYAYSICACRFRELVPLVLIAVLAIDPGRAAGDVHACYRPRRAGPGETRRASDASLRRRRGSLDGCAVLRQDRNADAQRARGHARSEPLPGFDEARVLGLAALASSDGGQDPVDAASALPRAARATRVCRN